MSNSVFITNAKVVLSHEVVKTSVLVINGSIWEIDCKQAPAGIKTIDANGSYLLAGFIDTHVHGGGGADFMDGTVEDFETVTRAHLRHGTTALCPTSMTATPSDLEHFIRTYLAFLKAERRGAKTLGLHLEGPYLSGASQKAQGAQRADLLRYPDMEETERLYALADGHMLRWDAAPELPGSAAFATYLSKRGVLCSIAHSLATTDQALVGFATGFSHVTHCYNATTTYHKEGQTVLDGVVEAAYLQEDAVIELICDGCHIPRGILLLALKIKGAEKVCAITDAMRLAGTDRKIGILGSKHNGTEVIVDGGVAKLKDLSSFAGSIATADRCLKVLCGQYGVSVCDASKMLSFAPAKLHHVEHCMGSIRVGNAADLVLADDTFTVTDVFLDGIKVV